MSTFRPAKKVSICGTSDAGLMVQDEICLSVAGQTVEATRFRLLHPQTLATLATRLTDGLTGMDITGTPVACPCATEDEFAAFVEAVQTVVSATLLAAAGGTITDQLGSVDAGATLFLGATKVSNGTAGLVPAPMSADETKYLRGDGTWGTAQAAVLAGQGNPNMVSPTATPVSGDYYLQTGDGFVDSGLAAMWLYNGAVWIQTTSLATAAAMPASRPRSYYSVTTALIERYTALQTAATIVAQGYSGVGGATIIPYVPIFNDAYLLDANATEPTLATQFTVPTSYILHEVAVTPASANTYFIRVLGDREQSSEVWVCEPITGIPVKRLASKAVVSHIGGTKNTIQLSPKEEYGSDADMFEWLGFEIPVNLVNSYSTDTNTLKLALRPGCNNSGNNQFYMAGYAMAKSEIGVTINSCLSYDNQINGGTQLVYAGINGGMAFWSMTPSATINGIRVALPQLDKDIYLSVVALGTSGNCMQWVDVSIAHSGGNVALGRPKPNLKSPLADAALCTSADGLPVSGWIIPAATLAAKAILPANSGIHYLELNLVNRNPAQYAYGTSWVAETLT